MKNTAHNHSTATDLSVSESKEQPIESPIGKAARSLICN